MGILKKRIGIITLGIFFTLCSISFATVKTLQKGAWMFGTNLETGTVSRIGVETINSDGSGQGDAHFVNISDFTAKYVSSLQPLIQATLINGNTKIADSASDFSINYDVAYGITDQLSVLVDIPYRSRKLSYSQGYISAITTIKTLAGLGSIPGKTSNDFIIPPKQASGEGIGDITVAFKYRINENLAFAGAYRGGFLKIGKDPSEVTSKSDNFEELPTGSGADKYSLKLYYDCVLPFSTLQFTGSYNLYSERKEGYLDNNFQVKDGDEASLDVYSEYPLLKDVLITLGLSYRFAFEDKKYNSSTGKWETISSSGVSALLGESVFSYKPDKGIEFWGSVQFPITSQASLGVYDFPGRLDTSGIIRLGTKIYWL